MIIADIKTYKNIVILTAHLTDEEVRSCEDTIMIHNELELHFTKHTTSISNFLFVKGVYVGKDDYLPSAYTTGSIDEANKFAKNLKELFINYNEKCKANKNVKLTTNIKFKGE